MESHLIKIGEREIGDGKPCFIVAEISGNHHQNYNEAEELIRVAADAGVDAVKLQTYTPDTLTFNSDKPWFIVKGKDQPHTWKGQKLYDLYEKAYTPWDWQPKLKKLAESLGLILFSTPFDETAVDFLEEMNVPCYKIASYETIHIPLLKKVAQTGKPVLMSIGFASLDEIALAVNTLRENGTNSLGVLHCVTAYSNEPKLENANLKTIENIKNRFGVVAGFSDNNSGIVIPILAATLGGASIIEKHFILDRVTEGPDARFSLEPHELKQMVETIRTVERDGIRVLESMVNQEEVIKAMGQIQYGSVSEQEKENTFFRPSLWAKKDIKKGEIFSEDNIRIARPSAGLVPEFWDKVLGQKASKDIKSTNPLFADSIEGFPLR